MSNTALSASAIMNTANADFTLLSWEREMGDIRTLLEEVLRVKVLATLIWDYAEVDQYVNFFLDRKLSPSPSFVLSYDSTVWSYWQLIQWARRNANLHTEQDVCIQIDIKGNSITIMLHDRAIVKIDAEYGKPVNPEKIRRRAAEQALSILRMDGTCSKYLYLSMDDLQYLKRTFSLSRDLVNDLETAQIKGIEGDSKKRAKEFLLSRGDKVLPFKLLSCQKKPFDLQLDVQKTAEEVICHLKLNGLPLHGGSDPGRGLSEIEAIDSALEKSGEYLLEMTHALTHREFRIIETELVRRYVHDLPIKANILQQNCSMDLM